MPTFNISLNPAHLTKLQAVVATYNAQNGATLTVADWILQTLKEIAVAGEYAAAVEDLRRQHETDAQAALEAAATATRNRLLEAL